MRRLVGKWPPWDPVQYRRARTNPEAVQTGMWSDPSGAARIVQGFGTSMATTALGALILDTERIRGPLLNGVTAFIGLFFGAPGTGVLVRWPPASTQIIFLVLPVLSLMQPVRVLWMPKTGAGAPDLRLSRDPAGFALCRIILQVADRRSTSHARPAIIAARICPQAGRTNRPRTNGRSPHDTSPSASRGPETAKAAQPVKVTPLFAK